MNKEQRNLLLIQLDRKLSTFSTAKTVTIPGMGWVNAIRTSIGMSMRQLGEKLGITPQGVKDIERRESDGTITLNSLRETAAVLDMRLVYALVPKDGSLNKMIEKRARQIATEVVMRTDHTMHLENQSLPREELKRAIDDKTRDLVREMPRHLWD